MVVNKRTGESNSIGIILNQKHHVRRARGILLRRWCAGSESPWRYVFLLRSRRQECWVMDTGRWSWIQKWRIAQDYSAGWRGWWAKNRRWGFRNTFGWRMLFVNPFLGLCITEQNVAVLIRPIEIQSSLPLTLSKKWYLVQLIIFKGS